MKDISGYKDVKGVSSYAVDAVKWAIGNKIISGKENGTRIDPKGNATRAEAAAMIQNYCTYVKWLVKIKFVVSIRNIYYKLIFLSLYNIITANIKILQKTCNIFMLYI